MTRKYMNLKVVFTVFALILLNSCASCPNSKTQKIDAGIPKTTAVPSQIAQAETSSNADTVVAEVGGKRFFASELDKASKKSMQKIEIQTYDIKRKELEGLINESLWQREATARGISVEKLKAEIQSKASAAVSDAEAELYYQKNSNQAGSVNPQLKERIKGFLANQKRMNVDKDFLDSLKQKYNVRIYFEPPRFDLSSADLPIRGNPNAPVTVVEFSDFQCPFCGRIQSTITELRQKYPDQVKWVYKHFPLPMHSRAVPAAMASLCAEEQGKFWEYRDRLFTNQKALERADLVRHAEELGLNKSEFEQCLDSNKYKARIDHDVAEGVQSGVEGTPAFFVNGRPLSGAQPLSAFQEIIEDELAGKK